MRAENTNYTMHQMNKMSFRCKVEAEQGRRGVFVADKAKQTNFQHYLTRAGASSPILLLLLLLCSSTSEQQLFCELRAKVSTAPSVGDVTW